MDLLAGGHVDEVTFRQAIELLRAEDWEALRLLLAGTICKLVQLETDGCVCLQYPMPSAFETFMQALLARGQPPACFVKGCPAARVAPYRQGPRQLLAVRA